MRIIAGTLRGRRLAVPPGDRIRPTLDRVREALFSSLGDRVEGARFLDLFAGSGANGMEALSRGASSAVFVDDHAASLKCIRQNLAALGLEGKATVVRYSLPEGISRLDGAFDLIYADPPYDFGQYESLLEHIQQEGCLQEGGSVIIEHRSKISLPAEAAGLSLDRQRRYGNATLSVYA